MPIRLTFQPFDPWAELSAHQAHVAPGKYGACASFVGTMRDCNHGDVVEAMFLEHYPGMTERELEQIVAEAKSHWKVLEALVIHRVGEVYPGEPIVLVAVWAAHRGPACEACRFILEALKTRAPFWKQEKLPTGVRWVEKNTPA